MHSSLLEGQPAGAHAPPLPRPVPGPGSESPQLSSASPKLSASLVIASLEYDALGGDSDWEWKLLMMDPKTGDQEGVWTREEASLLGKGGRGGLYGSNGGVSGQGLRGGHAVSRTELLSVEHIAENIMIFPDEVNANSSVEHIAENFIIFPDEVNDNSSVEHIAENFIIFPDEVDVNYDIHSSDSGTSSTLVLVGDWSHPCGFNQEQTQTLRFKV